MTDFAESQRGLPATPEIMAELSYEFANDPSERLVLVQGWRDVFRTVSLLQINGNDTGERTSRNRFARDSENVDRNIRRNQQLKQDFQSALTDIAYADRTVAEIRHRKTKLRFPSDLTAYSEEHRKQVEGGVLTYKSGKHDLPTRVAVSGDNMLVSYDGRHVLTIKKTGLGRVQQLCFQ